MAALGIKGPSTALGNSTSLPPAEGFTEVSRRQPQRDLAGEAAELWTSTTTQEFTDSILAGCAVANQDVRNNRFTSFQNAVYRLAQVLVTARTAGLFDFDNLTKAEIYFIESNVDRILLRYSPYLAYFKSQVPSDLGEELEGYLRHLDKAFEKPAQPPEDSKLRLEFITDVGRVLNSIYSHLSADSLQTIPPPRYRFFDSEEEDGEEAVSEWLRTPLEAPQPVEIDYGGEEIIEDLHGLEGWLAADPTTFQQRWLDFGIPATYPSTELVEIWNDFSEGISARLLNEDLSVQVCALNFFSLLFYGKLSAGTPRVSGSDLVYCMNTNTEKCCSMIISTSATPTTNPVVVQCVVNCAAAITWFFEYLSGTVNLNQFGFGEHPIYLRSNGESSEVLLLFSSNIPTQVVQPIFELFKEALDSSDQFRLECACLADPSGVAEDAWEARDFNLFEIVSGVFVPAFQNSAEALNDPDSFFVDLCKNLIGE